MKRLILTICLCLLVASPAFSWMGAVGVGGSGASGVNTNFVSKWDTTKTGASAAKTIALPLFNGGTYNFTVDYGDSSGTKEVTAYNDSDATHTYAEDGTYTVTISGTLEGFRFNDAGDKLRLVEISNWGTLKVGTNQGGYFYGCANLQVTATDTLDTSNVTNMSSMFNGASAFNQSVANFDTSNVTNMSYMFYGASVFNQSVANFDTSNVTNMGAMFCYASAFNQSVANFDTSNVTSMSYMFFYASAFNQSVANFDTSNVTSMYAMFSGASAWSTTNYDAALIAWAAQDAHDSVDFSAGSTKYTSGGAAAAARASLIADDLWTITDGGAL